MRFIESTRHKASALPWLTLAVGLAAGCALLNLLLNHKMGADTANFYTRMASQFGQGHYEQAFFHSVPPLVPVLAGIFCKLGLQSWAAMKVVSGVFFVLAVIWSYRLARLRFEPAQAQWCALLYVCCSRLLRYGMAGQLEAAKMFLLLLAAEQAILFCRHRRWWNLVVAGSGCAFLALARNEGITMLPLVCLLFFLIGPENSQEPTRQPVVRYLQRGLMPTLVVLVVCLIIWSPWMMYQYRVTGYFSLNSKLSLVVVNLFDLDPSRLSEARADTHEELSDYILPPPGASRADSPAPSFWEALVDPQPGSIWYDLTETVKGLIPYLLLPALLGIWLLIKHRKWTSVDTAFLLLCVAPIVMFWWIAPRVIKRLIVPYVPFYFSWTVLGICQIRDYLATRPRGSLPRRIHAVERYVLVVFVVVAIWDGMSSVRGTLRGKDRLIREVAAWIVESGDALNVNQSGRLQSQLTLYQYHNNSPIVIASLDPEIASWADADWCRIGLFVHRQKQHRRIIQFMREMHVDIIIVDDDFRQRFPHFDSDAEDVRPLTAEWVDEGIQVLGLAPTDHPR